MAIALYNQELKTYTVMIKDRRSKKVKEINDNPTNDYHVMNCREYRKEGWEIVANVRDLAHYRPEWI